MNVERRDELKKALTTSDEILQEVFTNLKVIDDIASKIDLLALNASIEAARVGKSGRGFTVVADEISKLSEKTQRALTEINSTVTKLTKELKMMQGHLSAEDNSQRE